MILLTLALLLPALCLPVFADTSRLVDNADLLASGEEKQLLEKLDSISERQGLDIVVVTVPSTGNRSPMVYADDFYDRVGYRKDGILLLISMEERDWYISTAGYGITAITDAGRECLADRFVGYLSDGDYLRAFEIYADGCDEFIDQARTGEPYDVGNLPKEPFDLLPCLIISLVLALIVALIVTGVMRSGLKSVRFKRSAAGYVKTGSLKLTESRDLYLYTHVSRIPRPQNNSSPGTGSSTHTSSSGTTHGGGGGKF